MSPRPTFSKWWKVNKPEGSNDVAVAPCPCIQVAGSAYEITFLCTSIWGPDGCLVILYIQKVLQWILCRENIRTKDLLSVISLPCHSEGAWLLSNLILSLESLNWEWGCLLFRAMCSTADWLVGFFLLAEPRTCIADQPPVREISYWFLRLASGILPIGLMPENERGLLFSN